MAASLFELDPDFRALMEKLYQELALAHGYEFRPVFTIRSPWFQARLWRQSRSKELVESTIQRMKEQNALYLANVLESVGPQHGRWATNALPGLSWHNWKPARACDSVLVFRKKLIWGPSDRGLSAEETQAAYQAYDLYKEIGESMGMTCLDEIHDIGHMQQFAYEIPRKYTLAEVAKAMEAAWGLTEVPGK